jgi:hypothetical protein
MSIVAIAAVVGTVASPAGAQEAAKQSAAPTVAGSWKLTVESPHGAMAMAMELKVDAAGKVTGTLTSEQIGKGEVAGTFADGRLTFAVAFGPDELSFAGRLKDADTLIGMLTGHGDMACTGTRTKTR